MQRGVFAPSKAPSEDQALLTLTCSRTHRFAQWGATLAAGGFEVCPAAISLAPSIKSGACFWELLSSHLVCVCAGTKYIRLLLFHSLKGRDFSLFAAPRNKKTAFMLHERPNDAADQFSIFSLVCRRACRPVCKHLRWCERFCGPGNLTPRPGVNGRHLRCRLWMGVGCVWWFVGTNY